MSDLSALQQRHEAAKMAIETHQLEQQVRAIETAASIATGNPLRESFGDIVDRNDARVFDNSSNSIFETRTANRDDRKHGNDYPFYQQENDLLEQLGISRHIYKLDGTAVSVLGSLASCVIGTGFVYNIAGKEDVAFDESARVALQAVLDSILEYNEWQPFMEDDIFQRSRREGEYLMYPEWEGSNVAIEHGLSEHITKPSNPRAVEDYIGEYGLDWDWGVASLPNRPSKVKGYFINRDQSGNDWDYIPKSNATFIKLNSDREVKRGFSDFYCEFRSFEIAAKLCTSLGINANIQSNIALIRKHATTSSQNTITSFVSGQTTSVRSGSNEQKIKKSQPGTILDTQNTEYMLGAMGQNNAPTYIPILQAVSRRSGRRWNMTEAMITGSMENMAAYTAALAADSPFLKGCVRFQGIYKWYYQDILWKAIGVYIQHRPIGYTLEQLKAQFDLNIEAESPESKNKKEENEMYEKQHNAGILSLDTWATKVGLDLEAEKAKGAEPKMPMSPFGMGGGFGQPSQQPMTESEARSRAAKLIWGDYP